MVQTFVAIGVTKYNVLRGISHVYFNPILLGTKKHVIVSYLEPQFEIQLTLIDKFINIDRIKQYTVFIVIFYLMKDFKEYLFMTFSCEVQ